jgi:hypothetical protein
MSSAGVSSKGGGAGPLPVSLMKPVIILSRLASPVAFASLTMDFNLSCNCFFCQILPVACKKIS